MKQTSPFYRDPRWARLRRAILQRDGYQCQISRRYGKHIPADTVHHIFPRERYPEYQWAAWNLIAVSRAVHDTLHDRNTNALTDAGAALLRRTAQAHQIPIPPEYQ